MPITDIRPNDLPAAARRLPVSEGYRLITLWKKVATELFDNYDHHHRPVLIEPHGWCNKKPRGVLTYKVPTSAGDIELEWYIHDAAPVPRDKPSVVSVAADRRDNATRAAARRIARPRYSALSETFWGWDLLDVNTFQQVGSVLEEAEDTLTFVRPASLAVPLP